jgi:hypothetical protein
MNGWCFKEKRSLTAHEDLISNTRAPTGWSNREGKEVTPTRTEFILIADTG